MTSYGWSPSGRPTVVWCLAFGDCDPHDPLVTEVVAGDWEALDPEERTTLRARAAALGIVGVEPGLPVQVVAAGAPGIDALVLRAFGLPPEGDDVEEATFTIALDPEGPSGTHPEIEAVRADGAPVSVVELGVGEEVHLDAQGFEDLEQPDLRWYTDAPSGSAGGPGPGGPGGGGGPRFLDDGSLTLVVQEPFEGIVVVVLRDGEGGVDWIDVPLTVGP